MTLQEIMESDKEMLTPRDISKVLGCDPYNITLQARKDPKALGFPVIVLGTRTKIPKKGFLKFIEGMEDTA